MSRTALLLGPAFFALGLAGCGDSEIGAAPVVKVSAEQRAKDLDQQAEATIKWLEGLPPAERQGAVARSPQVSSSLDGVSDPALRARIAALGLPNAKP